MGWSKKYKRSIDCNNPKGFSEKAHCDGKKKNEATSSGVSFQTAREVDDFQSAGSNSLVLQSRQDSSPLNKKQSPAGKDSKTLLSPTNNQMVLDMDKFEKKEKKPVGTRDRKTARLSKTMIKE